MLGPQVVVYHGNKRTTDLRLLADADVVLTTFSIVESEHRRNCLPGKVPCRYCRTRMLPDRLRLHLKSVPFALLKVTEPPCFEKSMTVYAFFG